MIECAQEVKYLDNESREHRAINLVTQAPGFPKARTAKAARLCEQLNLKAIQAKKSELSIPSAIPTDHSLD